MIQNKNCKHSSKIWLHCIRVFLSPMFSALRLPPQPPPLILAKWSNQVSENSYFSDLPLFNIEHICIMIASRDHSNWVRHGMNSNNKKTPTLGKIRLTHKKPKQTKPKPNQKPINQNNNNKKNPQKNSPTHQTLKHILSSLHISNYLSIQRQVILEEERSSDQSHRILQQNQRQKPHLIYH